MNMPIFHSISCLGDNWMEEREDNDIQYAREKKVNKKINKRKRTT